MFDSSIDWHTYAERVVGKTIRGKKVKGFPDFLVVSPPRTGSTWLAGALGAHPQIFIPEEKETRYFDLHWKRQSIDWYVAKFSSEKEICGEVSPTYSILPTVAVNCIVRNNPRIKIVIILRSPTHRLWSHFKHSLLNNELRMPGSIKGDVDLDSADLQNDEQIKRLLVDDYLLCACDYVAMIKRWCSCIGREQIHIGFFENLIRDPKELDRIVQFLGCATNVSISGETTLRKNETPIQIPLRREIAVFVDGVLAKRRSEIRDYLEHEWGIAVPKEWNATANTKRSPRLSLGRIGATHCWYDEGMFSAGPVVTKMSDKVTPILKQQFGSDLELLVRESGATDTICAEALEIIRLSDILLRLDSCEQWNDPRLVAVCEGYNIMRFRGKWIAIAQDVGEIELRGSKLADLKRELGHRFLIGDNDAQGLREKILELSFLLGDATNSGLVVEGYCGFNILRDSRGWYGFRHGTGPIDISRLDAGSIETMCRMKQCVTGGSLAEVKVEIITLAVQEMGAAIAGQESGVAAHGAETDHRLDEMRAHIDEAQLRTGTELKSVQERLGSLKEQQEAAVAHGAETDQRLDEMRAHIDEAQLRTGTELKSVQERLGSLKEQQEAAVAHGAETDQRLDEMRAHIDEAQLRTGTELKSVQEQLGRIVNNPFVRMSRSVYRLLRSAYRLVFRGRH
ncbi:MAG: hypothetical protein FJ247_11850 [Nitrospira sp.]|nr:hypothetical protein [Nitrospira sp.]